MVWAFKRDCKRSRSAGVGLGKTGDLEEVAAADERMKELPVVAKLLRVCWPCLDFFEVDKVVW
jgi:hypothetical protein